MWAKRLLWLVALLQLLFLGGLLYDYEKTKTEGALFRLELQMYDPYDMFRGNYMALNFKENRIKMPVFKPRWDEKFYVKLVRNPKTGFAMPKQVSLKYNGGDDWVEVSNSGGSVVDNSDTLLLFSFMQDRFFISENKVKKADEALRKATADSSKRCWAEMRVRNGTAILTDVKIDGKSLKDLAN
ncbi:MAG: hypothetical protein RLZZ161_1161 [Bacteroidota bacterium]